MFHLENLPSSEKDEKIILSLRRHWFILFKEVLNALLLALLPIGLDFLLRLAGSVDLFEGPLAYPLTVTGLSMYYLGLTTYLYNSFVDYYLDNWIITNYRVINIESKNLFNRTISEQSLYRVQDVTAESKGLFPTFLNYGTIFIQSAGEKERFVFHEVPQAFERARQIQTLVNDDKNKHPGIG